MSTAIKERWQDPAGVLVAALMIVYLIVTMWPEPALKISPLPDPRVAPHTTRLVNGTPASYDMEGGR